MMDRMPSSPDHGNEQKLTLQLALLKPDEALEIVNAGRRVIEAIQRDFPKQLPDGIIFPDTSGRPLAYVLREPLAQLAQRTDHPEAPRSFFFQAIRNKQMVRASTHKKRFGVSLEDVLDSINGHLEKNAVSPTLTDEMVTKLGETREQITASLDEAKPFRERFVERAHEIRQAMPADAKFIIVDDYISDIAVTVSEIRRAFGEQLPAYSFLSNSEPEAFSPDEKIFVARKDTGPVDPKSNLSVGLSYRRPDGGIGVKKNSDSKYPDPLPPDAFIKGLRHDLGNIGHVLAQILDKPTAGG